MKTNTIVAAPVAGALVSTFVQAQTAQSPYKFECGYPAAGTADRVHLIPIHRPS